MFLIRFHDKTLKAFVEIPRQLQERINKSIEFLAFDPYRGKKLQGQFFGLYSLRVWPYRIIYRVEQDVLTIIILEIGHRQGVYK